MNRCRDRASRGLVVAGLVALTLSGLAIGCSKGEAAATGAKSGMTAPIDPAPSAGPAATAASAPGVASAASVGPGPASVPAPAGGCKHAACADNFFVDIAPPGDCAAGASCSLKVTLVAMGDFHVNDEYPYRFKAEAVPDVAFGGTDPLGKEVFSKSAGDWRKADA